MSDWKLKRFWTDVTVETAGGGFGVRLDGRGIKTPAKRAIVMPTQGLADAVAAEWAAQKEEINPLEMPATRTVNAAIDKVATQHAEVADMLAAYGDSDLLCYRADTPQTLIARQAAAWDPMLDWGHEALGARLAPRTGVMHTPQDPAALARLKELTHALTAFELAAFHDLVSLSGSLVLAFATARGHEAPEAVWEISRLDETWQAEQWGRDEEAETQANLKRQDFLHAARMFALSTQG
ncbi:MAG: ATP12 family protein [Pseudomonadota bacterium]